MLIGVATKERSKKMGGSPARRDVDDEESDDGDNSEGTCGDGDGEDNTGGGTSNS